MHMADALLSPGIAGVMYVLSGTAACLAARKVKNSEDPALVPEMGVLGAFVFAAQMLNFAIPGSGSSGHLCGGMLLAAVVGPWGGFLTLIGVLVLQCLAFGDGGLLALGANVWNMAFYGCFVGGGLVWPFLVRRGMTRKRIILASILGSVVTLQMGAFSVAAETTLSGIAELPFSTFLLLMQPIHLAIGLGEGLVTAGVLCFVARVQPEVLESTQQARPMEKTASVKKIAVLLLCLTAAVAGGLSLFASQNPDGLEWTVQAIAGSTELGAEGAVQEGAAALQEKTALMPDYDYADGEGNGTSTAGVVGSALTFTLAGGVGLALAAAKKRRAKQRAAEQG